MLASIALAFGLLALAALPSRALRHFPVVVIDHRFDLACAGLAIAGGVAIGLLIGLSSS